jgi:(p)ppGpp synthase/HD superfamily hydrolase
VTDKKYKITPHLYKALTLAFKLHGHDARKKSTVPYIAHLLAVCELVQLDGGNENEAIAALLHDALEDKPKEINRKKIRYKFGKEVLKMIEVSIDTPKDYTGGQKPPWKERKDASTISARQIHLYCASQLRIRSIMPGRYWQIINGWVMRCGSGSMLEKKINYGITEAA